MARQLRPVALDFADTAPVRLSFTGDVGAVREAVYKALADEVADWPHWFGAIREAMPTESGRGRLVRLRGGVFFRETVMAAQPSERYAYRVDETNAPGVRALVEDWTLAVSPSGGTRLRWTMALDGGPGLRAAARLGRGGMGRSFAGAVRALDPRLRARVR